MIRGKTKHILLALLCSIATACDDEDPVPYVTWPNDEDIIYLSYPNIKDLVDWEHNASYCSESRDTLMVEAIGKDMIAVHVPTPNMNIKSKIIDEDADFYYYGRTYDSFITIAKQNIKIRTTFYKDTYKLQEMIATCFWYIKRAEIDGVEIEEGFFPDFLYNHGARLRKNANGKFEVDTAHTKSGTEEIDE